MALWCAVAGAGLAGDDGLACCLDRPERPYSFRRRLECVHEPARRDFDVSPGTNDQVVADGVSVSVPAGASEFLRKVAWDFSDYLAVSMSVESRITKSSVADVWFVVDRTLPARQYRISVGPKGVEIRGADERSVAQAFYRLEDRMNLRRAPFLTIGEEVRTPVFAERLTHPGYGYAMYPDEHLAAMAHAGMTAIIVYINSVDGNGLNNHRADVGAIIRRAARHGLDTYLYSEIPMFAHPDDGDGPFEESYGRIAARYPDAKGIIIVGESCAFPSKDPRVQPRKGEWGPKEGDSRPLAGWFPCSDYPDWLRAVERAIHAHAPNMKTVFWTYNWGWAPEKDRLALIDALPGDTILQATFDMFEILPRRNGITTPIADYSLSFAGPSAYFASEAAAAKRRGLTLFTQANAGGRTWDFGTAPYEPFPFQWRKRWAALVRAHDDWGLSGIMENHHYGWSPTFVAELEKEAFTEGGLPFDAHLRLIAARDFGEANADRAVAAWRRWSAVIGDYVPTDINQYGPFRCGPAYPYTAGRPPADRKTFPVEPLSEVGSAFIRLDYLQSGFVIGNTDEDASVPYMKKEIELLESMAGELEAGARVFAGMPTPEARRMARLGSYLAACCRTARNVKRGAVAEIGKDAEGILAAARDEHANARAALKLVEADSHLGWEPMMDYVGGPRQIRWKLALMEKLYGIR